MAAIDFPSPVEGLKHLSWIYTNGAWVKQPFDVTFILASSGNWESTYTTVDTESANWNSTYTTVTNESADWDSTYTTVTNESADWGIDTIYDDSLLQAASGDWNSTYTTVSANSGNWNNDLTLKLDQTTQQTVINGAPIFNGGIESYLKDYSGVLAVDTINRTLNDNSGAITVTWDSVGLSATNFTSLNDINAAGTVTADCGDSTEWCSTHTTVGSNSASWGSAGSGDFCSTIVLLNEVSACGGTMSVDGLLSASSMITTTLTADGVYFNTGANRPPELGELVWDDAEKTLDLGLENGVVLQIGEEQLINVQASEEIKDGQVVYASGAFSQGNTGKIVASLYSASSAEGIDIGAVDELFFLGVATQNIAQDTSGYITTFGKVRNINVYNGNIINSDIVGPDNVNIGSSDPDWPVGKVLYVSTSAGRLTNTPPESPNKVIPTAMVISQSGNGHQRTLFVRQEHGYHLEELHDVRVTTPQQNDVLSYNSTLESWDNVTSNNWESTFTTMSANSANWVKYDIEDITTPATWVLDEDTLVSDSATKVPTQQSVKAYVDGIVTGVNNLKGGYDASTDTPPITAGIGVLQGDTYYVTVSGNFYDTQVVDPGDLIIATTDNANLSSEWIVVNRNIEDELIDRWNSTYTTVSTQSANWDSTYTTVSANSGIWDNSAAIAFNEGNTNSIEIGILDGTTETGPNAITIQGSRLTINDNVASGANAIAIGTLTKAAGDDSVALGTSAAATGNGASAIGNNTIASGGSSTAVGPYSRALAATACGFGHSVTAFGAGSLAYGYNCQAKQAGSAVFGRNVINNTANTAEIGHWQGTGNTDRRGAVRMDSQRNVSFSIRTTAVAMTDGGTINGSEPANTLGRQMIAFRRFGNDFYLDANDPSGSVITIPLDSTLGDNVHSHVQAASGSWDSTYTTVSAQSANWSEGASTGVVFDTSQGTTFDHASLKVKDTNTGYSDTDGLPIGDTRGAHAVDLQIYRQNSDEVAGGVSSTIVGGQFNKIHAAPFFGGAKYSTILGGISNEVYGQFGNTIGGSTNKIGDGITLFPAHGTTIGQYNFIKHENCFSYNDQSGGQFETKQVSTFNIHATNGFRLVTGNLNTPDPINIGDVLTCYDTDGHSKWASPATVSLSADEWNSTYTTVSTASASWSNSQQTINSSAGTLTLDVSLGQSAITTLTENITTFTITNAAAGDSGVLIISSDGGGWTFPDQNSLGASHIVHTGSPSGISTLTSTTSSAVSIGWYCDGSKQFLYISDPT